MEKKHRRYHQIADITIEVNSDLRIEKDTFNTKFNLFEVEGLGEDNILIRHHFSLPKLDGYDLGTQIFRNPPWAIYRNKSSWIYLGIFPSMGDEAIHRVAVFNHSYTKARIYNDGEETFT